MNVMKQVAESKKKAYAEATKFMLANPQVPFPDVGARFGISNVTASRLWAKATNAPRRAGRKAGVSPAKRVIE